MSEVTNETQEQATVIINEPEAAQTTEKESPSREDLKSQGWSARELDAAEKRGMIKKKEKKEPEVKADAKAEPAEETSKDEPKEEEKKSEKRNYLPEFKELTPEQEKLFNQLFPPGTPQRAFYYRAKNERGLRQASEAERDRLILRMQELEAQINEFRSGKHQPQIDENGQEIDPDDKPLTVKQLKELRRQEEEERQKQEAEYRQRGGAVAEALRTQEEYAKSVYPDYDETLKLAKEVMQNMDSIISNRWEQEKAVELIKALQVRAANADKFGIDDYNAALISYEIGKLHPNYGKSTNGPRAETHTDGKQDPKNANGSVTPEQMKRIEQNTQRRVSSASIPGGGGSRTISVDEMTVKDVLKMSPEQRASFKTKHPEKFAELLRG